jgi:hypothetical protein
VFVIFIQRNKIMKYTRTEVNNVRQSLVEAYNKIEKVFESIETPEHYEAFHNMCECLLNICNVWAEKLRPRIPCLQQEKAHLFDLFSSTATNVVNRMNTLIDLYTTTEQQHAEYMQKYAETEERLRMEREIVEKLNKEKEEEIKKESKPIGFIIGQTKKKRKYTKRKKNEQEIVDNTNN